MKTYIKPTTKSHQLFTPHHMLITSGTAGAPTVSTYEEGENKNVTDEGVSWE